MSKKKRTRSHGIKLNIAEYLRTIPPKDLVLYGTLLGLGATQFYFSYQGDRYRLARYMTTNLSQLLGSISIPSVIRGGGIPDILDSLMPDVPDIVPDSVPIIGEWI